MIVNYHPNFWQFVSSMTAEEMALVPISGDLSRHGDPFLVRQALRALNTSFDGRYFYTFQDWMTGEPISGRVIDSWPKRMRDEAGE